MPGLNGDGKEARVMARAVDGVGHVPGGGPDPALERTDPALLWAQGKDRHCTRVRGYRPRFPSMSTSLLVKADGPRHGCYLRVILNFPLVLRFRAVIEYSE